MRTDDPEVVLKSLRVIEAILLDDQERLKVALTDSVQGGRGVAVMLSTAALAGELLRSMPDGEERLREWMIATELEIPSDDTQPPSEP